MKNVRYESERTVDYSTYEQIQPHKTCGHGQGLSRIGIGAQSTLGGGRGRHFWRKYEKFTNARILHDIYQNKNNFSGFVCVWGGGGGKHWDTFPGVSLSHSPMQSPVSKDAHVNSCLRIARCPGNIGWPILLCFAHPRWHVHCGRLSCRYLLSVV